MGEVRYTVRHTETHDSLFPGKGNPKQKVLGILQTRSQARVGGELVGFVPSEWYVTAWDLEQVDAGGEPEIVAQVNAQEFIDYSDEF